jgi:hypothetical protein
MIKIPSNLAYNLPAFIEPKGKHIRLIRWLNTPKNNRSKYYITTLVKGNNKKENRVKALQQVSLEYFQNSDKKVKVLKSIMSKLEKGYTLGTVYIYSEK